MRAAGEILNAVRKSVRNGIGVGSRTPEFEATIVEEQDEAECDKEYYFLIDYTF